MSSDDDDELSKLEAMANSISDGSDTESENDSETEETTATTDDPLKVKPLISTTDQTEPEILAEGNTDDVNSSSETIVTINVEGVKPENAIISDSDFKELSVSSLTSIPSISSSLSGSKLQDIFDGIGTTENIEENIQESYESEQVVEHSVVEVEGTNNDLFSGYNLDEILRRNSEDTENNEHLELDDEPDHEEDEESDVSSSDDDIDNDYNSLQDLCDNYLDHLTGLLQTLQKELERNLLRQSEIDLKVSDLNFAQLMKSQSGTSKHRVLARKPISIFAAPYFKDKDLYGPPPNEDTVRKRQNKELDVWIEFPRPFSEDERRRLKMYVREDAIRIKSLRLRQEKENIENKLNTFVFDEKVKEDLSNQLIAVNQQIGEIQSLPDDKMFVDRFEEYDWEKISVTNFNNVHSPKECELQWQNLVHPTINRSVFSPEEDKLLKRLAEALHSQDWDSIAREMETGRTGHACFVRYMTRHNVTINNRKWEKSEDDRLRRLIAHCRINNYIPWTKVSYYMERRTKDQCYQRYVYSLKDIIKKGPFSDAEDILLFIGEKLYKNDWSKISEIIPCRTAIQLHSRYNHFLKADHKPWTEDEDVALLEQVRKHGLRDWVLISQQLAAHFGGERTRGQCRQRFAYIYKCFKKNPALALGSVEYKEESGLSKRRLDDIYDKLSERFEEFKAAEEAAGVHDTDDVKGDSFGYIVLPNGERISRKSLTKFIRFIQEFLPKPNPPTPMPRTLEVRSKRTLPNHEEEELFKKPLKASGNFNTKPKKLKVTGYEHKKFKTYKNNKKGPRNRDKVGQTAFKTPIDRNISKFFRPTWIMKNRLNLCSSFGDKDLEMLTTAGLKLAKILDVKKLTVENVDEQQQDKNIQLFLNFLQQQSTNTFARSQTSPSCKVAKTYGRTYSRRAFKRSDSRSATPSAAQAEDNNGEDVIDFVPPSMSTLVGFRGILLTNAYLADPTNHADNIRKEKDYVDRTVMEGTVTADVDLDNDGAECNNLSHLAADQLLVKRFLQLFLWPAKMSNVAPTNQEDLFSEEEEEEEVIVDTNGEC